MKLKVFLWQISHDKLQTGVALKKRKWKGSPHCSTCGALETAEHIFFNATLPGLFGLVSKKPWAGTGLLGGGRIFMIHGYLLGVMITTLNCSYLQ
jgi:hypothetical protein